MKVLKRRIQVFTAKVSSSSERHLVGSSPREVEDAVNELQRQLGDFDRSVEEYRQNLEMSVKLQQAMEEVGTHGLHTHTHTHSHTHTHTHTHRMLCCHCEWVIVTILTVFAAVSVLV